MLEEIEPTKFDNKHGRESHSATYPINCACLGDGDISLTRTACTFMCKMHKLTKFEAADYSKDVIL